MKDYVVVSFSGGKDSTAMLLHMIELGEHIDEVINVDTGMEFPEMYDHIDKVKKVVEDNGIKFTVLRNEKSFEWMMLEKPIVSKKYGTAHKGYGFPTPVIRWCTGRMKVDLIERYFKQKSKEYHVIRCIGLASDEFKRLQRPHNQQEGHRHPLVEWGWSEADCLEYCYSNGYDWGGLYRLFNRVSCWCCPLSAISELRKLWENYPELWARLQGYEDTMIANHSMYVKFRGDDTVHSLSLRFEKEAKAVRCQSHLGDFVQEESQ